MASSGTYFFQPSLGEFVLYAFNIIGIRPAALTQTHMQSSRMAMNLLLARWANQGVNLWKVELVTMPVVEGQNTYPVDPSTVMILDAYVTTPSYGTLPGTDRILMPISRTEWASYPEKLMPGFTTVFWFDRLLQPTITIWPVPDGISTVSLSYYAVTQIQDANFTGSQTADIPYRWFEAFADGLAYRLAKIWAPQLAQALSAVATESYNVAAFQDVENANTYISPMLSAYYRP